MLVITGPSGVGKGTLIRTLLSRMPELHLSVSATTRAPRAGEENGRAYWFLDPGEFEERIQAGEFLEHATYAGNRYGTLRSELDRVADLTGEGRSALVLEIELEGARQVRDALPEAVRVFIRPPSLEALRERLVGRGADTAEVIESRLAEAERELAAEGEFAHVITNDRLEDAVEKLTEVAANLWTRQPKEVPQ